jgi:hypothetical protein
LSSAFQSPCNLFLVVTGFINISNEVGRVKSVLISFLFPPGTPLHQRGRVHLSELSCHCPTCWLGPSSCFIDSVLPTKHLFDHFRP